MSQPLLAIVVPTYNRERDLRRLLDCFDRELADADGVTVLVSDNASTDGSWALLQGAAATRPWLTARRQDENVGAVANCRWLVDHAPDAEYLWIFGDDDLVLPGGMAQIVAALRAERPAWLHLPHVFVDGELREQDRSLAPAGGRHERFPSAGALWQSYHHWLTFLTASILRTAAFREAIEHETSDNAYAPLLWFFRGGLAGPCVVLGEHVISGSQEISWADRTHVILTLHFTRLWDDGLHAGLTEAEFGATLDGLYGAGVGREQWRRQPLDELLRAVARFPQSRGLRRFLWEIALEQGRGDALPALEQAARVTGDDDRARALVAEGEALFGAGDRSSAAARFVAATELDPTQVDAWNDLAVVLSTDRPAEAAALLRAALFVAPSDDDALANLAALI